MCVIQRRERPLNARLEGPAGLRGAELGRFGERLAERFLVDRGLELLARNHSCRHGEADLVLRDGETLIFVEVKARASAGIDPAAAVDLRKQRRLQCAAQDFVLRARLHDPAWRYDIVAIEALADPPGLYALRWIPAAFDDPSL